MDSRDQYVVELERENHRLRVELEQAEARARSWRRIAQWIHAAATPPEEHHVTVAPPAPPYLGPPKWHGGDDNKPIRRVVMHCTAGAEPDAPNAARNTAAYTKGTDRPSSWHYCADSRESIQLTYDSVVAYHDGTNDHSIGYELCCSLSNEGGIIKRIAATGKALTHWMTRSHRQMLRIAAADVARLCLAYDVPIRRIRKKKIRAGEKGICGHNDMRLAFPGSTTHWDPGPFFPWRRFVRMVRAEAEKLLAPPVVEEKPPTRVTRARDLLTEALTRAPERRARKIRRGLDELPRR